MHRHDSLAVISCYDKTCIFTLAISKRYQTGKKKTFFGLTTSLTESLDSFINEVNCHENVGPVKSRFKSRKIKRTNPRPCQIF